MAELSIIQAMLSELGAALTTLHAPVLIWIQHVHIKTKLARQGGHWVCQSRSHLEEQGMPRVVLPAPGVP